MRLSEVLHRRVVTRSGEQLGRLYDLRARPDGDELVITSLVVGKRAILQRLGFSQGARAGDSDDPSHARIVPWAAVEAIERDRLVVADDWYA